LQIIGDVADDRIPSVVRFCLDLLARQYLTLNAEVSAIRSATRVKRLERSTVKPSILRLIFALSMRRRAHPSGRNNVWKRSTVHSKALPSRSI
jgi:hypothetical protein